MQPVRWRLDVTKLKAGEFSSAGPVLGPGRNGTEGRGCPDWTAGVLMGVEDGAYQVQDVQRFRVGPAEVEEPSGVRQR